MSLSISIVSICFDEARISRSTSDVNLLDETISQYRLLSEEQLYGLVHFLGPAQLKWIRSIVNFRAKGNGLLNGCFILHQEYSLISRLTWATEFFRIWAYFAVLGRLTT
jgi:hypothetical protein